MGVVPCMVAVWRRFSLDAAGIVQCQSHVGLSGWKVHAGTTLRQSEEAAGFILFACAGTF